MRLFCLFPVLIASPCILGHLPEQDMDVPEIVAFYGYPVETITTETPDGYFLVLHRIPFGKNNSEKGRTTRPIVFLQHGLFGSSADWTTNRPEQSAAYVFADAGFDVWMGNIRGNVYSIKHRTFSHYSTRFWNFTFDDHSSTDLPTMLDIVLNITGQESLYYVGHSQGTAMMFAHGSDDRSVHKKIRSFFALAPVTTVAHIRGLMAFIGSTFVSRFGSIVDRFGAYDFLPSNAFQKLFAYLVCGTGWFKNPLCGNLLFQIAGPDSKDINMTRVMIYMDHTPAGSSTKNVVHWAQMVASGKFCKYDYGARNLDFYGQSSPPVYELKELKIPTYLYYSLDDWLADPQDVEGTLLKNISKQYLVEANHLGVYNHLDYIWGMHAVDKIYQPIVRAIRKQELMRNNRP